MCSRSCTFNASSDDALAAIERLSVQTSQDLDMGELGPGLPPSSEPLVTRDFPPILTCRVLEGRRA